MEAVAVRFKRAMAPFSELARVRLCESSGSEHSAAADSSLELEDLVDSFLFDDGEEEAAELKPKVNDDDDDDDEDEEMTEKNKEEKNYEEREMIHSLLRGGGVVLLDEKIRTEIELACQRIGMVPGTEIYKRRLMRELRKKGFDAGLCKSRWDKTRQLPAGSYEYVDIFHGGNRYIVETSLTGQFEIARPTAQYLALLQSFPTIFICRPETLKQLVRLMCAAAKESLKSRNMHLPPWRKNSYMMQKWFGSYKRTTNKLTKNGASGDKHRVLAKTHMPGFDLSVGIPTLANCSEEYVKRGLKVGNLAAAFKGIETEL
ncbi:hypothetical protein AAC387_Pa03g1788 [Persea americana]